MGYFNNKRNAEQMQKNIRPGSDNAAVRCVEGADTNVENLDEVVAIAENTGRTSAENAGTERPGKGRPGTEIPGRERPGIEKARAERASAEKTSLHTEKPDHEKMTCTNPLAGMLIDFSNPSDEMQTERDFRMLQGMYPDAAKELLPHIEEECDRMEYDGSAMFDEYPDYTTIYRLQKKILIAAKKGPAGQPGKNGQHAGSAFGDDDSGAGAVPEDRRKNADTVPKEDLIRVMLLQEMHRRRDRRRSCR